MHVAKKTVRDVDVREKRVLLRAGWDVPRHADGSIRDDARIRQVIPTLEYVLKRAARVIVLAHSGRPRGVVEPALTLRPVADRVQELLPDYAVRFVPAVSGNDVAKAAQQLRASEVLILENVRFDPREKQHPDRSLAHEWAQLADLYVNDAFNNAHRDHTSMTGFKGLLPSVMGEAFSLEYRELMSVMESPQQPLCVVMGGVKFETRIPMIENVLGRVGAHSILFGSALAHVFLAAQGRSAGAYSVDAQHVETAKVMLHRYNDRLVLPEDVIVAPSIQNTVDVFEISLRTDEIPDGMIAVDIGPRACEQFSTQIEAAGSVIWNGPMGAFETPAFAQGTRAVAEAMSRSRATTVVGGGDTGAAVASFGLVDKMSFVSTAGGASLALFEGQTLPAYAALDDRAEE